jgi:hypothetical protein
MHASQEFDADRLDDAEGTGGRGGVDVFCQDLDLFCEQHVHLGSDAALRRKRQTQRRLERIQALWEDPARFEAVVKSGRYLRLCTLTQSISDCDERAWRRLKNEILAVRAREFLCGSEAA